MWTSVSTEAYLTVTGHLIENWRTRDFVLETHSFHGQHTADNVSLALKRITEERGTTDKVVAVVTDNGLNLIVKDGSKTCPGNGESAGEMQCDHVTQATQKLKGIQQQLAEHKLIQSVDNRWNFTCWRSSVSKSCDHSPLPFKEEWIVLKRGRMIPHQANSLCTTTFSSS